MERDLFGRHPEKLTELITLRAAGWPYIKLGRHFEKDHTTIIYNIKRFAPHLLGARGFRSELPTKEQRWANGWLARLEQEIAVLEKKSLAPVSPQEKYRHLIEDECVKVNQGKSYKKYRQHAKARVAAARAETMARLKREYDERVRRRGKLSGLRGTNFNKNGWW